jgi:hypothetical protein
MIPNRQCTQQLIILLQPKAANHSANNTHHKAIEHKFSFLPTIVDLFIYPFAVLKDFCTSFWQLLIQAIKRSDFFITVKVSIMKERYFYHCQSDTVLIMHLLKCCTSTAGLLLF